MRPASSVYRQCRGSGPGGRAFPAPSRPAARRRGACGGVPACRPSERGPLGAEPDGAGPRDGEPHDAGLRGARHGGGKCRDRNAARSFSRCCPARDDGRVRVFRPIETFPTLVAPNGKNVPDAGWPSVGYLVRETPCSPSRGQAGQRQTGCPQRIIAIRIPLRESFRPGRRRGPRGPFCAGVPPMERAAPLDARPKARCRGRPSRVRAPVFLRQGG